MAAGKRLSLLEDEDYDARERDQPQQLGYNEKYVQRFTHNKKREDLHRLQELQKKGLAGGASDDDESSSEEEDDDGLLPARTEEKIFETLMKIKKRDPIIYSSDTKFFGDDDEEQDEEERKTTEGKLKKQKPLYLKDVNARQLLEGGEEDEEDELMKPRKHPTSYLNEQEELKRAFLQGVREAEGGGDDVGHLLRLKKKTKEALEREAWEAEKAVEDAEQRAKDKNIAKRLEEYFGKDDELDHSDKFLKEYLLNKGWVDFDEKQSSHRTYNADAAEDISEDEEAIDKQDQFEKDYNFRFQDGVDNTYVKGHSRTVGDSVRKKSESRKKQRENKRERESGEAQARREELKRLKNVKKKEMLEKLAKIRAVAGVGATRNSSNLEVLGTDDLDDDFDPDEYDKKMKEAFGEEYYDAEDPEFVGSEDECDEIEKAKRDAEDDLLRLGPEGGDLSRSAVAGFAGVKAKLAESSGTTRVAEEKKKKKLKVPFEEKLLIDKHLKEYYKLDYEDVVGDLPTRFTYRTVQPNKYGLRTKDILGLDDKELNQYISLKRLAPYTTEEWEPRRPAPRLSSKGRRKIALNSEEGSPKNKSSAAVTDLAVNFKELPKRKEKSSATVVDNNAASTENIINIELKNGEHVPAENGLSSSAGFEEKKKKNRKRKKPAGASPLLPMSRLLSYAPQSAKKRVGRTSKKKVTR